MAICNINHLENELSYFPDDEELFVEIRGVVHQIHEVRGTSQGVILLVDTDQEEREMR